MTRFCGSLGRPSDGETAQYPRYRLWPSIQTSHFPGEIAIHRPIYHLQLGMITLFALKMILAQRARLATALLGVVFALVLVNVQAGLFIGLLDKAGLLVDQAGADLWIGHQQMNNVDFPRDISRDWLTVAQGSEGVQWARPCTIGASQMTMPSGRFETVLIVGFDREHFRDGTLPCISGDSESVLQPHGIAVDQCEDYKLGYPELLESREVGGQRVRVVAKTYGATSFLVTPYIFTTDLRARDLLGASDRSCSYVLVKASPGADLAQLQSSLQTALPDAQVLTGPEYAAVSKWFWLTRTGLGISFGASTLLGLIVGLVVAGQAIYSLALDRVTEFAAMKAMGAGSRQLLTILFTQSAAISFVGCNLGLLLTIVLGTLSHTPTAPIELPNSLLIGSAVGLCLICTTTCLVPFFKIRKVDPLLVLGS